MIPSSQISLFQDSSRQVSAFDSTQLRINRQSAAAPQANENAVGSELTLMRQAAYRYSSQEQLAFSGSSTVTDGGQQSVFTSAQLAEKTSELFLMGQQALSVSRAALGGDAGVEGRGSLSVSAGRYMFYSESESRSFASTGTIALENGETIDFTLSLRQSQSRTYEYSELVQIQERPLTDPLVINFGTATARLTDTLFEFDLNGNGETGQFATLGSGSGYLVLDRNGNGKVDDGSELFGPRSGSGFGELARFDDDGNRWIDANRGSPDRGANGLVEARVEAIRSALEKLNEIREKQKAFIEESEDAGKPESPITDYLKLIDKMRLEMLNSQDEKKQAASRYLEFASL